ncbi:hypothetical protein [Mariniphaga sediminis]|uniref:hypothetical protein n=1 Tax=Mariniphaga sediminis TaxID=1628158 RepID=UPI00356AD4E0
MGKTILFKNILKANGYKSIPGGYQKGKFKVTDDILDTLNEQEFAERLIEVDEILRGNINITIDHNKELKDALTDLFSWACEHNIDYQQSLYNKVKSALKKAEK